MIACHLLIIVLWLWKIIIYHFFPSLTFSLSQFDIVFKPCFHTEGVVYMLHHQRRNKFPCNSVPLAYLLHGIDTVANGRFLLRGNFHTCNCHVRVCGIHIQFCHIKCYVKELIILSRVIKKSFMPFSIPKCPSQLCGKKASRPCR